MPDDKQERKTVHVAAAMIYDGNRIFATQRGYGDYKDIPWRKSRAR